jgi:hypothetical protein
MPVTVSYSHQSPSRTSLTLPHLSRKVGLRFFGSVPTELTFCTDLTGRAPVYRVGFHFRFRYSFPNLDSGWFLLRFSK